MSDQNNQTDQNDQQIKVRKARHFFKIRNDKSRSPIPNTPNPEGYTPDQIRRAYGLEHVKAKGSGQTIAIIDAFKNSTILQDFEIFDKQFDLGKPHNLRVFSLSSVFDEGWALEQSLDVQWVHAIAPHAKIILIQANTDSLADLLTAVQYANNMEEENISIVSMSWGGCEFPDENIADAYFTKEGVVYLAAAGDSGSYVIYPSSSPNVISVGGTSLNLDADGNRIEPNAETGWTNSGGGPSIYEPIPQYQSTYGLTGMRQTPDVSFFADPNPGVPVYDSSGFNGNYGWFEVGGTSLSTPCFGAILLLANELREEEHKNPLSNVVLLDYLYNRFGKDPRYSVDFNDITVGSSGTYSCTIGYDNVTGLGTPKNAERHHGLVHDLVHHIP